MFGILIPGNQENKRRFPELLSSSCHALVVGYVVENLRTKGTNGGRVG